MASNVFGNPVTDATVRAIYPTLTNITAMHRADVALLYRNEDEKAVNASRFVHNLEGAYGTGTSTLCMVYNATGGTVSFVRQHTWEGNVWRSPYPQIIQNGQWAGFLHVRGRLMGSSKEAFVYRGAGNGGAQRDWMMAFNTPRMNYQNRVYTEIRVANFFNSANWNTIDNLMERQTNNHSNTMLGTHSNVNIGAGSSPEFVGIMTLPGLAPASMAMATDFSAIFASLDSKYEDDGGVEGEEEEATPATAAAAATPAAE